MNDTSTVFGAGVSGWDNSLVRLENVRILNCQAGAACGIYTANNTTITVVNSVIAGNTATTGFGGGAGFSVSTPTLINVTMVNNTAAQSGGAAWFFQSTSSVKNSICWTNQPDVFSVNAGTFQCTYSDVFGGYTGTGNINVNPAFVGSGDHPFALQDTSRCRNAGNPDTTGLLLPLFDLAGSPRFVGGRIDMGAYEVQNAPPVPGWTVQTSGVTTGLYSVKAVDINVAWAGGAGGTVLRTINGGTTWTSVGAAPISGDVYSVAALDANTAFVTTSPSATYIYRTTNGGTTWTQVYTLPGAFIDALAMADATTGYAVGDPIGGKWLVAKTTDGGATWARMATEPTPVGGEAGWTSSLQVMKSGANTYIWYGSSGSHVYRSTDGGATWSTGATAFIDSYELQFNSPTQGVAGGEAAARTTDGGVTWIATAVPGSGNIFGVACSGTKDYWIARGTVVYRSTDAGITWTSSYTSTGTFAHTDFATVGSNTHGWATTFTGVIAAFYGTVTGIKEQTSEIPTTFGLDQNYPNPFNPSTNIKYQIPSTGRVNLSIYNILGQRIATLKDEVQSVGYYNVIWDGRNDFGSQIASGVYFYRIEAKPVDGGEAFTSIKKMLFLK